MNNCYSVPTVGYDVNGMLYFNVAPATGTLTVTNCLGGTQVFNAPFASPLAFSFTNLPQNGVNCQFTAIFSADTNCADTVDFMAPTALSIPSVITDLTCFNSGDGQVVVAPQGGLPNYSYNWSVGGIGNNAVASNLNAGQITITVTDANGCTLDSTFTVNEPAPFTFTTDSMNSNCFLPDGWVTVNNMAGGTGPYTYDWGAGPTPNDSLLNLIPGSYSVTITDANGCDTTISIGVGNNATFTASITGFNHASCNGATDGDATADGSDPLATYNFSWNTVPVQNTQTATGLGAGTYIVTVTDAATGCVDTVSITITEPPVVTANAGADVTICTGGNTNLTGTGGGGTPGYTYNWDNGLGAGQTHNVSPVATTVYNVTVTDANGCTAVDAVTVTVTPPLTVVASADVYICPGGQANISAQAGIGSGNGGPYTYTWNNGLGMGQNQSVSPNSTTTYIVTLTDGCSPPVSDSVTVFMNPVPVVDFIADTFGLCESPQQGFTFTNTTDTTGGMVGTSVWDFGDGNTGAGNTVTHAYGQPGSYDITLTVTSTAGAGGCTSTLTKTSYVTVYANPTADFTMDPNPTTMFNTTVNVFDQSYTNIVSWNWNIDNLDTSSMQNPTYTFPEDTGNYLVTLTVVDANGCINTTSNTVIVMGEYGIWVPNAFTPDFDGVNDGFYPNGFGITDTDYGFYIFNRWGELIFESHNKFEPWMGDYKGSLVQNGVYVWRLEFRDINGKFHTKVGHVTIVK